MKQAQVYEIIKDEKAFIEFIGWLPELQQGECFYISLLARNKYLTDKSLLKGDKAQLKRFTCTKKEYILDKVRQLEVAIGAYRQGSLKVPEEALALYITPNPRSLEKATKESLKHFANLITNPYNGYNPHQEVLSEIQRQHARKVYFDLDFDDVDLPAYQAAIEGKINKEALTYVKTRGGFHLLVKLKNVEKRFEKSWYRSLAEIPEMKADIRGDALLPVIGCRQGDFVPYFV